MSKNNAIMIKFVLPLVTFYRSGEQVQVIMTKSQLADYTRRVMDGAVNMRREKINVLGS